MPSKSTKSRNMSAPAERDNAIDLRLRRLEWTLRSTQRKTLAWKKGFIWASVALVLTAGFAAAAIVATQKDFTGYSGEAYTFGESTFTITPTGLLLAALPATAAGTSSGTAVEMDDGSPGTATEALDVADWYYQVVIAELAVDTLPTSSPTYEAELFLDGVSQGSLFYKQDTGDDSNIESATLRWDMGTSLPSSSGFVVQITEV